MYKTKLNHCSVLTLLYLILLQQQHTRLNNTIKGMHKTIPKTDPNTIVAIL